MRCYRCGKPATKFVNTAIGVAVTAASILESACDECWQKSHDATLTAALEEARGALERSSQVRKVEDRKNRRITQLLRRTPSHPKARLPLLRSRPHRPRNHQRSAGRVEGMDDKTTTARSCSSDSYREHRAKLDLVPTTRISDNRRCKTPRPRLEHTSPSPPFFRPGVGQRHAGR